MKWCATYRYCNRLLYPINLKKYILYQGAVNEGRSFETLIPAMKHVNARLIICGDGNFMEAAQKLVQEHGLSEKLFLKEEYYLAELRKYTLQAWAGVTLFENNGNEQLPFLGNRFFDYIACRLAPAMCELSRLICNNNMYNIAVLT